MRRVGIIGVGQTPYRAKIDERTEDLIFKVCREALDDAGLSHDSVDAVVAGYAPDGLGGENGPERAFIGATGGIGKTFFRTNTGGATGESAVSAAVDLIQSGRADVAIAVAAERMGQVTTVPKVFNTIFDPIWEKDVALSTLTMAGVRATRQMILYGYTPELWAHIAVRNFAHAAFNPLAQMAPKLTLEDVLSARILTWPIRKYDACPVSEGACAVVVAAEDALPSGATPAWIAGRSSHSDTYFMGDRIGRDEGDLVGLASLERSAEKAYSDAGITDPLSQFDVIEIQAAWTHYETMALPALGLCTAEDVPELVLGGFGSRDSGRLVMNPSGSAQAANPVGATGLVRIAEAALQVRKKAGERQIPKCDVALATSGGGTLQFASCMVLTSS